MSAAEASHPVQLDVSPRHRFPLSHENRKMEGKREVG
jgi:hypothetical protein